VSGPQTTDRGRADLPPQPGQIPQGRPAPAALSSGPPRYALPLGIALQAAISAGDGLVMVVLADVVFQRSHAAWAVAAVFLAITVPITLLAPLAGLLLDRLPPRPVLVSAAAAQAAVAALLMRASTAPTVLGLATGFGICAAILQPGLGIIVPRLTTPARITRANGYLQAATWGGFTAGPLLAGGLMAAGGPAVGLAGVVALYAAGAIALAGLPFGAPTRTPAGGSARAGLTSAAPAGPDLDGAAPETAATPGQQLPDATAAALPVPREPLARQISAGLRFLRGDREAGLLVTVVGLMVAFGNMAVVVEVVFAERVLRSGPTGYAILVAAWTAGMLAGTFLGGRVPRRRLAAVTLAGTVVAGVGVALAGATVALWQTVAAYMLGGVANGMETVTTRSFLNYRAPEHLAGRVFALYSGVLFGAASVGMAVAGSVLGSLSPRLVLAIAGIGGVATGVAGLWWHRRSAAGGELPPTADAAPRDGSPNAAGT
jgi:MFS family permease